MGGAFSIYRERKGAHRVLVGKPDGSRPLGKPRHRSEELIYQEVRWGTWTGLIWFRTGSVTGCYECLWVPENVGNFLTS